MPKASDEFLESAYEVADFDDATDVVRMYQLFSIPRNEGICRYATEPGDRKTSGPTSITEASLSDFLQRKEFGVHVFLGKVHGKAIAIAIAICQTILASWNLKTVLNIHDFFVVPEHRGKGVGVGMLEFIKAFAIAHGFDRITLETNAANDGAIRLYKRFGFRFCSRTLDQLGEIPKVIVDRFPDLTLQLSLELK